MNSPRIAAFRTFTVQSPYSQFMSPNPCHSLDGDHSFVDPQLQTLEKTMKDTEKITQNLSSQLGQLLETCKKREDQIRRQQEEKRKIQKKIIKAKTMLTRKRVNTLRSHDKNQKDTDVQSNLSLKVTEAEKKKVTIKEDSRSMKSLKMRDDQREEGKIEKAQKADNFDSISSTSFKSQMSRNKNFNFPDQISEETSNEYESDEENEEEEEEKEKSQSIDELTLTNMEIKSRCNQLAPMMERIGRLLIDFAPHMAMVGSRVGQDQYNTGFYSSQRFNFGDELSMRLGEQQNAQQIFETPEQFNFASPNSFTTPNLQNNDLFGLRSLFGNSVDNPRNAPEVARQRRGWVSGANLPNPNILKNMENYGLSSNSRSLKFQIPVMLNPGELLSITPRQNHLFGDGNVHLHLNAQVHLPRNHQNVSANYVAGDTDYFIPSQIPQQRNQSPQNLNSNQIPTSIASPSLSQVQTQPMSSQNQPSRQNTPSEASRPQQFFSNQFLNQVQAQNSNNLQIPNRRFQQNQPSTHDLNSESSLNSPTQQRGVQRPANEQLVSGFTLNEPRESNNLNVQDAPIFGGQRYPISEGPNDFNRERRGVPSKRQQDKRTSGGGLSQMREGDRNDEILDEDSFNGTIEERDENEEPEMQDISFRDLDIGGSTAKPVAQRNVLESEEIDSAATKEGTDLPIFNLEDHSKGKDSL